MFRTISIAFAVLATGCGASSSGGDTLAAVVEEQPPFEPAAFLQEVGAESTTVLTRPTQSLEELDAARRAARGTERRSATLVQVVALSFAAEEEEGAAARRHRRRAEQMIDAVVRHSRRREELAEVEFIRLWMAWRAGHASAAGRAERYTTRHTAAGDLTTIAWMIRGEIALADGAHDDAVAAFRFALGHLGHPLYAYALFRTAHTHAAEGNTARASETLSEVEQLGCASDAGPLVTRIATAAASENASGLRRDTDGVTRPASCPSPDEHDEEEEDTGWRPAE